MERNRKDGKSSEKDENSRDIPTSRFLKITPGISATLIALKIRRRMIMITSIIIAMVMALKQRKGRVTEEMREVVVVGVLIWVLISYR